MKPRTIALLCVVAVVAMVMQGAVAVMFARHLLAPQGFNGGAQVAFAPIMAEEEDQALDIFLAPPGQQPAQPVAAEELAQVRGEALEARNYDVAGPFTHE